MGEFPTRITAADFVTPPEFADSRLAAEGSGRIGGTRFALALRKNETFLADLYEQIPIRVFPVQCGPAQPLLVYLASPTAGLMDGDAHAIHICAGAGTAVVVTGQSATRVHPCCRGFCTQQWDITVADGAVLVLLPGPTIPYAGSRFFHRVNVRLGQEARFIWGDTWFAGRYARGQESEQFRFAEIVQDMQVVRENQLVFRDRFAWHGPWTPEVAHWHFGDHPCIGNLFSTGWFPATPSSAAKPASVEFMTSAGDTCRRWAGHSSAVIDAVARTALQLASSPIAGFINPPWLLAGCDLARTHWFVAE
jgi:urease accessory protein